MSLKTSIKNDLVEASKARNKNVVETLRLFMAALKNADIAQKKELSDKETVGVISAQVKRHKEAIDEFKKAGRGDLLEHEEQQLAVLEKYLPEQLSDEELEELVLEVAKQKAADSPKAFGLVMGEVMKRVQGQADGNKVKEVVEKVLKG